MTRLAARDGSIFSALQGGVWGYANGAQAAYGPPRFPCWMLPPVRRLF